MYKIYARRKAMKRKVSIYVIVVLESVCTLLSFYPPRPSLHPDFLLRFFIICAERLVRALCEEPLTNEQPPPSIDSKDPEDPTMEDPAHRMPIDDASGPAKSISQDKADSGARISCGVEDVMPEPEHVSSVPASSVGQQRSSRRLVEHPLSNLDDIEEFEHATARRLQWESIGAAASKGFVGPASGIVRLQRGPLPDSLRGLQEILPSEIDKLRPHGQYVHPRRQVNAQQPTRPSLAMRPPPIPFLGPHARARRGERLVKAAQEQRDEARVKDTTEAQVAPGGVAANTTSHAASILFSPLEVPQNSRRGSFLSPTEVIPTLGDVDMTSGAEVEAPIGGQAIPTVAPPQCSPLAVPSDSSLGNSVNPGEVDFDLGDLGEGANVDDVDMVANAMDFSIEGNAPSKLASVACSLPPAPHYSPSRSLHGRSVDSDMNPIDYVGRDGVMGNSDDGVMGNSDDF